MIAESKLIEFANDPQNEITMGECDKNAVRFFRKFSGEICLGKASFVNNEQLEDDIGHYWNIVKSNSEDDQFQIIDIINYKNGEHGIYKDHREGAVRSIEYMEHLIKQREHEAKAAERLRTLNEW